MNPQDTDPTTPFADDLGPDSAVGPAADAAEKPKRRRAPRKAPAAAAELLASEGSSGVSEGPLAHTESTSGTAPESAPQAAAQTGDASPGATGSAQGQGAGPAQSAEGVDFTQDAEGAMLHDAEGGLPRSRNRRRGRRGEAATEGAAEGAAEGTVEGTVEGAAAQVGLAPDADANANAALRTRRARALAPEGGDAQSMDQAGERGEDGRNEGEAAGEPQEPFDPPRAAGELFNEVLSGSFDTEAEPVPPGPDGVPVLPPQFKRVLRPHVEAPKLQKVLAQAGLGSRRDLEQMVLDGRVGVNGQVAHTGQRIVYGDRIFVDGKPVRYRIAPPPPRVLAYHKPAGEVVSHDDPQNRPTVFRRLPRLHGGKWQSVGRLDLNTEGLLLFCSSGDLANQLMHPRFGVEREYAVRSLGMLSEENKARLIEGVEIDGQACAFQSIADGGGEGANHWYRVVITEGRNREVRRLFEAAGHAVSRLIRIRYGSVVLPRGLKRGIWVELPEHDVRNLRQLAELALPSTVAGRNDHDNGPEEVMHSMAPEGAVQGGPGPVHGARGPRNNRRGRSDFEPRADGAGAREGRPSRTPRPPRPDGDFARGPRPPRADRAERAPMQAQGPDGGHDHGMQDDREEHFGAIPNPLQQTFDRRAIQQAARQPRRELSDDGPIPNPLQQTYDKRALQHDRQPRRELSDDGPIPNPLQQTFDKRFSQGGGTGFGGADGIPQRGPGGPKGRNNKGGFGGGGPRGRGGPQGGGNFGNGGGYGGGPGGPGGPGAPRGGRKSGGRGPGPGSGGGGGGGQQDPNRAAGGFIGADAYHRKGGGRGRSGGGRTGGGGGAGGGPR